ncbi:hypothetical protein ACXWTF_05615 [Thiomicrolovo sp. ZZH C-3]
MLKMKWALMAMMLLAVANTAGAAGNENGGLFHKKVQLYNGKGSDPYTVFYPIEVTEPGRVTFEIKVTNYTHEQVDQKKRRSPFRWYFVDSRFLNGKQPMKKSTFQEWAQKANKYNPVEYIAGDEIRGVYRSLKSLSDSIFGKKKKKKLPAYYRRGNAHVTLADGRSTPPHYDIDQMELMETQGMYFIVLDNYDRQLAPEFEVKISYPGKQQYVDEALQPKPMDLGILQMGQRKGSGKLYVTLQNFGEGTIPDGVYARKGKSALSLMLTVDGKSWGGVTLAGLDKRKRLAKPGGKVTYTFENLTLKDGMKITAALNMPRFEDTNRRNNRMNTTASVKKEFKPATQLRPVQAQ